MTAHFCAVICVKVPKIKRHFLTHGFALSILTYHVFLVMINTDAQAVAQAMSESYVFYIKKKVESDYAKLYQGNGYLIVR